MSDKPAVLKVEELRKEVISCIEKSGLPAFICQPVFQDINAELMRLRIKELEDAKQEVSGGGA